MKINTTLWPALLTLALLLGPFPLSAQTEIAIEDDDPAPVQKATPEPPKQTAPVQTAPAQQEEDGSIEVEEEEAEEKTEEKQEEPEPAAKEEPQADEEGEGGTGAMRPVYEAGIKAYQQKSYWKAIALLSKASEIKDPGTPKYYYAEAHAMMGVIFQFYLKKSDKACRQYQLALKIDPKTRTALKYRHKVCR